MKKKVKIIIVILVLIILIGISIYFIKNKYDKEEFQNTMNDNSNSKTCIVLNSSDVITLECEDNVIYKINLENKYEVGNILKITYEDEFLIDNFLKTEKLKSYNYLADDGIFKEYYDKALKKLKSMTIDEKIGQILLARTSDINQVKDLTTYKFGGYLLFKRDFTDKTKEEVIDMIKKYQDSSKIPMLIAADEEGGIVSRISSNRNLVDTPFKSPRALYLEGGLDRIKEDTIYKNEILASLGINLNLAPVVDVSTDESDYMYKRSIGLDADLTSEFAKVVIEASKDSNVSYCLKHFPGYGNNSDTHIGLSYDTRSLESIKEIDLKPFIAGIDVGAEAVLVSHNIVSSIDNENPASISESVHNLLRSDLSFTGIVITDDLSMKAIDDYYKNEAVINAINSGNDLLIVSDYKNTVKEIKEGLEYNKLSENILNKRVLRILAWKYYKGLIK
ncbi:MAG: beta-hexosaminidase [Bacilli bacterium]|nr:beta-hexosaminidase [Bacilli bacterium]